MNKHFLNPETMDITEFLNDIDIVVVMVKHDEIKNNIDKLKETLFSNVDDKNNYGNLTLIYNKNIRIIEIIPHNKYYSSACRILFL